LKANSNKTRLRIEMKIVLIIHQSAEMYGSDKVLLYLAQGLQKRNIFQPIIVLPSEGPLFNELIKVGIEVHIAPIAKISRAAMSPRGILTLAWQAILGVRELDRVIGDRNLAVVHSNTLAVFSGAIWALLRRKQHLWHVHEIVLFPKIISRAFALLVRILSDKVVSNSKKTESWLLSEQPKLLKKSVVSFNGLPIVKPPTEFAVQQFRSSVGAQSTDVIVTLAGRINKWKGQELLIAATTLLKRKGVSNGLRIVIVGGPAPGLEDLPRALRDQAEAGGVADICSFCEFMDDIWPVWFGSDIAVVPSTEPEPFGMVAIEAMAAGLPVIAAEHGGLLDIVVESETGLFFKPKDVDALARSLETLLHNAPLRKALGDAGRRRQEMLFSLESQISLIEMTYTEMTA